MDSDQQYKLTPDEFDKCSQAFNDVVKQGKIDSAWMMKNLMQALGLNPSNQYVSEAFAKYAKDGTECIEYSEFISLMEHEKKRLASPPPPDEDLREAFMSLGGNEDGSGQVLVADLKRTMNDFGLSLNVDEFIYAALGRSAEAALNYAEFGRIFRKIFDIPEITQARKYSTVRGDSKIAVDIEGEIAVGSKEDPHAKYTARGIDSNRKTSSPRFPQAAASRTTVRGKK